jgi:glyoxylase-like metal-dependent hydrolase (beta-lactamase superfamily II)
MTPACDFDQVAQGLFIWHHYSPAVKAELFSTAIATGSGVYLVDPVPLAEEFLVALTRLGPIAGVVVTNGNHRRGSQEYAKKFQVPIFARRGAFPGDATPALMEIKDGEEVGGELEVVAIEGAAAGEMALYYPADIGTVIVGDALIHFEPHGFATLPRKYCADEKEMRRSLRKLLDRKIERMLFAHGTPILSGAGARLRELLNCDRRSTG